jgi:hypothetical protein
MDKPNWTNIYAVYKECEDNELRCFNEKPNFLEKAKRLYSKRFGG